MFVICVAYVVAMFGTVSHHDRDMEPAEYNKVWAKKLLGQGLQQTLIASYRTRLNKPTENSRQPSD